MLQRSTSPGVHRLAARSTNWAEIGALSLAMEPSVHQPLRTNKATPKASRSSQEGRCDAWILDVYEYKLPWTIEKVNLE
jgi:hypothetical protein